MAIYGINFRATSGYVTDGANETYSLGELDSAYPITRGGFTFGWTSVYGDSARDRDSGLDRRLAGLNQQPNSGSQSTFRLDVTPGSYIIGLGLGDPDNDQNHYVEVLDNTTSRFTLSNIATTAPTNCFADAFGSIFTSATWPSSNVRRTGVSISTGTLIIKIGATSAQSNSTTITHLYAETETSDLYARAHSPIIMRRNRMVGY